MNRKNDLATRLFAATHSIHSLISRIKEIEEDILTPPIEKISQIKKIRQEMTKVGMEIDSIKAEITLLNRYNVN
jgi:hypothetical protein